MVYVVDSIIESVCVLTQTDFFIAFLIAIISMASLFFGWIHDVEFLPRPKAVCVSLLSYVYTKRCVLHSIS